jgi:hypothetical protein
MTTEELHALLRRLNGEGEALTDAELDSLNAALLARADELLDGESTPEVIAELEGIATAKDAAKELGETRAAEKAEAEAKRADLISRIKGSEPGETDETPEAEAAVEEPAAEVEPVEQPAAETPAETPAEEPVPVAASAQPKRVNLAAMNAARPRSAAPKPQPEAGLRAKSTVYAYEGGKNVRPGDEIPSLESLAELMAERLQRGTRGQEMRLANLRTVYPEERMVREKASAEDNSAKIEAAFGGAEGLVASGGICTPVAVDYSIPVFGATADRPLRDALPRFGADRGGIRFVSPVSYATPAGAVGIWTNGLDASPGTATKALYTVVCGSETQVLVDAITMRLKVGNMQGRFSPEQVAEIVQLSLSNAARTAELNLWAKINAASTVATAVSAWGATRDLLDEIDRAAMAMRYRNRANPNQQFRAIFPEFLKGVIRTDMAREIAHDNAGPVDVLAVTDQHVNSWFAVRGINPTFLIDPLPAVTGTNGYPFQGFASQAVSALNPYPVSASWNLFPEGAFQFLDGGSLDLGIVRDSTLDSTNDYETFVETFESVAYRSVEALQIISVVNPTGRSGASA